MLAVLLSVCLQITANRAQDLIENPVVLEFSRVLLNKSLSERFAEQGAFVVKNERLLYFVAWPRGDEKDMLRWYGRFPAGTIAILHTHCPWLPAPSNVDMRTARVARIPVYVITPSRISKTSGAGSEVVIEGDWIAAAPEVQ
jgi:hypothetical protein